MRQARKTTFGNVSVIGFVAIFGRKKFIVRSDRFNENRINRFDGFFQALNWRREERLDDATEGKEVVGVE